MAIIIPLKSVFDDKGLREAQRSFGRMGSSLKTALGVIGITSLVSGFREMAKAATDDNRAQAVLAQQMRNTVGATDAQIAASESFINSLQYQTGILDDNLRPSYAALVRATGDVTKAQSLLQLATDISAGTGKNLSTVTLALSKAYNGNYASLTRLGINVKGMADPMGALYAQFDGMAKLAASNDPFAMFQVTMSEVSEQLGQYILPYLKLFGEWISSNQGQGFLKGLVAAFGAIMTSVYNIVTWLSDNTWLVKTIGAMVILVGVMKAMWTVSKAIYGVTKAIGISELVISAVKASPGITALAAAGVAVTAAGAIWYGIDQLMGSMPPIEVPVAPDVSTMPPPKVVTPGITPATTATGQKVETLKEKLARLYKQMVADVQKSMKQIHDSLVNAFDITQMGSSGASISRNMDRFVKRMKEFAVYIGRLRGMGLNSTLLMQIVNAGPDGGLRAAKALAGDKNLINQANAAYGQVNALATSIAGNATRAQYAPVYNIRVDGGVGSGPTVGKAIVEAIKAYERTAGKVWTPAP